MRAPLAARALPASLLRSFDDVVIVGEAKWGKEAVAPIERESIELAGRPDRLITILTWKRPTTPCASFKAGGMLRRSLRSRALPQPPT
jgi:hypothetical protein